MDHAQFGDGDKQSVGSMVNTRYFGIGGQNIHQISVYIHVLPRIILNFFWDLADLPGQSVSLANQSLENQSLDFHFFKCCGY